jgi:hypothetical protein
MTTREELVAQLQELDRKDAEAPARHPYVDQLDQLADHKLNVPALGRLLADLVERAYPAKADTKATPADDKKGGK